MTSSYPITIESAPRRTPLIGVPPIPTIVYSATHEIGNYPRGEGSGKREWTVSKLCSSVIEHLPDWSEHPSRRDSTERIVCQVDNDTLTIGGYFTSPYACCRAVEGKPTSECSCPRWEVAKIPVAFPPGGKPASDRVLADLPEIIEYATMMACAHEEKADQSIRDTFEKKIKPLTLEMVKQWLGAPKRTGLPQRSLAEHLGNATGCSWSTIDSSVPGDHEQLRPLWMLKVSESNINTVTYGYYDLWWAFVEIGNVKARRHNP